MKSNQRVKYLWIVGILFTVVTIALRLIGVSEDVMNVINQVWGFGWFTVYILFSVYSIVVLYKTNRLKEAYTLKSSVIFMILGILLALGFMMVYGFTWFLFGVFIFSIFVPAFGYVVAYM